MDRRILLAGLWVALLLRTTDSWAAPGGLYNALLASGMTNLPNGVGQTRMAPVALQGPDASAGVVGIVEVTLGGKDPPAKIDLLVLADTGRAEAYAKRFDDMVQASRAAPTVLPFAPGASCLASPNEPKMICAAVAGRVVVFSFAATAESMDRSARRPVSDA